MKSKIQLNLFAVAIILITSCQGQTDNKDRIIKEVKSYMDEFHAADTAMNPQKMVDLLWPEFSILADGKRSSYQDISVGAHAFMASLATFHSEWSDIEIIPLGRNHAVASFVFTDSLVYKDGNITQSWGPNTFIWEKRENEWKLIFADADHYPNK